MQAGGTTSQVEEATVREHEALEETFTPEDIFPFLCEEGNLHPTTANDRYNNK